MGNSDGFLVFWFGFWVFGSDLGFWFGFEVQGSGLWSRVRGLGLRVQGLSLGIWGSWFVKGANLKQTRGKFLSFFMSSFFALLQEMKT